MPSSNHYNHPHVPTLYPPIIVYVFVENNDNNNNKNDVSFKSPYQFKWPPFLLTTKPTCHDSRVTEHTLTSCFLTLAFLILNKPNLYIPQIANRCHRSNPISIRALCSSPALISQSFHNRSTYDHHPNTLNNSHRHTSSISVKRRKDISHPLQQQFKRHRPNLHQIQHQHITPNPKISIPFPSSNHNNSSVTFRNSSPLLKTHFAHNAATDIIPISQPSSNHLSRSFETTQNISHADHYRRTDLDTSSSNCEQSSMHPDIHTVEKNLTYQSNQSDHHVGESICLSVDAVKHKQTISTFSYSHSSSEQNQSDESSSQNSNSCSDDHRSPIYYETSTSHSSFLKRVIVVKGTCARPFVGRLTKVEFIDKCEAYFFLKIERCAKYDLPSCKDDISAFFGVSEPAISVRQYIVRLLKYTYSSNSTFVIMLLYIERIVSMEPRLRLNHHNMHRIAITALTIACKVLDDKVFSNAHYARVGGVRSVKEMTTLELLFMRFIRYNLYVDNLVYRDMLTMLESLARPTYVEETACTTVRIQSKAKEDC